MKYVNNHRSYMYIKLFGLYVGRVNRLAVGLCRWSQDKV